MRKLLPILISTAFLQACQYNCKDAVKHTLWKQHAGEPLNGRDILHMGSAIIINDNCQIMHGDSVYGQIVSGEKRFLSGDEVIVIRYPDGIEVEYVSK